jgi:hypothetical protein
MPRPYGEAIHATKPNMLLHFDYLYIGLGDKNLVYLLIIKDDASGYVWLCPHETADAASTVESLVHWFSTFTICGTWCSDQGSHFKNRVVAGVSKALGTQHTFTVAYSPWSNGTVEVVCREVLRALRALISELHLQFKHWPSVVPILQSMLNNQPADRLKGMAPVTAMTALPASTPLLSITSPLPGVEVLTMDQIVAERAANLKAIQDSLDNMHRATAEGAEYKRRKRRSNKNAATAATLPNFALGDFVLVGTIEAHTAISSRSNGAARAALLLSSQTGCMRSRTS